MTTPETDADRADSLRSLNRRYFVAFCALPVVFALLAIAGWDNDSFPSWTLLILAGLSLVGIPFLHLGLRRMSANYETTPPDETTYALMRKLIFWQVALLPGFVLFTGARAVELPGSVALWILMGITIFAALLAVVGLSRVMILTSLLSDLRRNTSDQRSPAPDAVQHD